MTGRVATLEANQNHLASSLEEVVKDLKSIVIDLATRKGAEKLALAGFGSLMMFLGWAVEHMSHVSAVLK
jgi:hypothetical protein